MKITLLISILFVSIAQSYSETLTIYSSRKEHLIKPIIDQFKKEHQVDVKYHIDKAGALIQKLLAEGKNTKADVFITVDAGNLWFAKEQNLFQPVSSTVLDQRIPKFLKDSENHWFGFSKRVRTIVYNHNTVKKDQLSSYEDLASPKWNKKICLRTSKKVYNQSLLSMFIHQHGFEKAKKIVQNLVKNTVEIYSNDTSVIKAIASGQCSLGIVNSYYLGRLQNKNKNYPVKIFWPNQNSDGAHINISGGGIVKNAPNPKLAKKFLEWLTQNSAQDLFARVNMEYPVVQDIQLHPIVKAWGKFKGNSKFPLELAGKLQSKAIKLSQEVGYK